MKKSQILDCKLIFPLYVFVLSIGLSLVVSSCYPGDPLSVTDTDLVTTFRDADANFADKKSYAMPDSLMYVSDEGIVAGSPDPDVDRDVLAAIERNMQQFGYEKKDDPADADVLIAPLATTTKWVGGSCYPWYWGWWYPPYPGWCYPVTYTYNTGTLLIGMVDAGQAGSGSESNALWIAGINGILASSGVSSTARINDVINQAFAQSPYLKDGK